MPHDRESLIDDYSEASGDRQRSIRPRLLKSWIRSFLLSPIVAVRIVKVLNGKATSSPEGGKAAHFATSSATREFSRSAVSWSAAAEEQFFGAVWERH